MAVFITRNFSEPQNPRFINENSFKSRADYNGACTVFISPTVSHFYGTEYEIWAGFRPAGSTENFGLGRKISNSINNKIFSPNSIFLNKSKKARDLGIL